ncbi:hypothetical protein BZG36_05049 [Bifiguratus adelaidae]|uniref:Zinc finger PHD-type domain-containing protein n=1 Tax=Bifiguratus adelaidae TaxID=1938954 RepID=A0A261XYR5_9FUNG|nr:hypothetical protein BZG36_05049 [Bifiguratus adelaidae]
MNYAQLMSAAMEDEPRNPSLVPARHEIASTGLLEADERPLTPPPTQSRHGSQPHHYQNDAHHFQQGTKPVSPLTPTARTNRNNTCYTTPIGRRRLSSFKGRRRDENDEWSSDDENDEDATFQEFSASFATSPTSRFSYSNLPTASSKHYSPATKKLRRDADEESKVTAYRNVMPSKDDTEVMLSDLSSVGSSLSPLSSEADLGASEIPSTAKFTLRGESTDTEITTAQLDADLHVGCNDGRELEETVQEPTRCEYDARGPQPCTSTPKALEIGSKSASRSRTGQTSKRKIPKSHAKSAHKEDASKKPTHHQQPTETIFLTPTSNRTFQAFESDKNIEPIKRTLSFVNVCAIAGDDDAGVNLLSIKSDGVRRERWQSTVADDDSVTNDDALRAFADSTPERRSHRERERRRNRHKKGIPTHNRTEDNWCPLTDLLNSGVRPLGGTMSMVLDRQNTVGIRQAEIIEMRNKLGENAPKSVKYRGFDGFPNLSEFTSRPRQSILARTCRQIWDSQHTRLPACEATSNAVEAAGSAQRVRTLGAILQARLQKAMHSIDTERFQKGSTVSTDESPRSVSIASAIDTLSRPRSPPMAAKVKGWGSRIGNGRSLSTPPSLPEKLHTHTDAPNLTPSKSREPQLSCAIPPQFNVSVISSIATPAELKARQFAMSMGGKVKPIVAKNADLFQCENCIALRGKKGRSRDLCSHCRSKTAGRPILPRPLPQTLQVETTPTLARSITSSENMPTAELVSQIYPFAATCDNAGGYTSLQRITSSSRLPETSKDTDSNENQASEGSDKDTDYGEYTIRCVCNETSEDVDMVQCDICDSWLHIPCVAFDKNADMFICIFCTPAADKPELVSELVSQSDFLWDLTDTLEGEKSGFADVDVWLQHPEAFWNVTSTEAANLPSLALTSGLDFDPTSDLALDTDLMTQYSFQLDGDVKDMLGANASPSLSLL